MKKNRFYEIDFLRFLAALAVLLFHYGFRYWNLDGSGYLLFPELGNIFKYGYLGVDVFFVISGFVILISAGDGKSLRNFFISRFIRLYPAYWFATIFIFIFSSYWPLANYSITFTDFLINMTMMQSFVGIKNVTTVFWTLAIELHFYFIIAGLILTGQIKNLRYWLLFWLFILIISDYIKIPVFFQHLFILQWGQYFVLGAVFYNIWKEDRIGFLNLTMLILTNFQIMKHAYWYMLLKERLSSVDYNFFIVALIILILNIFMLYSVLKKTHNSPFKHIAWLGVLTYPLYLIHSGLGILILKDYINESNKFIILTTLSCLMFCFAYAIHKLIEIPLSLYLKRNLRALLKIV